MKLKFTLRAVEDLKRLRTFIAKHNPDAANRVSKRLRKSIQHLIVNSQLGKEVIDAPEARDFITGPYLVRYIIIKETVIILKIWHGKEDSIK